MTNRIIDFVDLNDTIINLLKINNTSTATWPLATSCTAINSDNITNKDLVIYPIPHTLYPYITSKINSWEEETSAFGNGQSDYEITVSGVITCVDKSMQKDAYESNLLTMIRNINAIIKNNVTLSGYNKNNVSVMFFNTIGGELKSVPHGDDSAYIKAAEINFNIKLYAY